MTEMTRTVRNRQWHSRPFNAQTLATWFASDDDLTLEQVRIDVLTERVARLIAAEEDARARRRTISGVPGDVLADLEGTIAQRQALQHEIIATVKILLGEDTAAQMRADAERLAAELRSIEAEEAEMTPATIRARREALGLTQEALAQRLSVAKTTVARWELGTAPVSHPEMLRLALDRLAEIPR
ncbi:MAG: helix-turn-helix domain-containing protein [Thermomicrobiales bacterium]